MKNLEPLVSIKDINTSIPEPLYAQYEKHNGKGTWKELYDWAIKYAEAGYAPAQESLGRYFLFCNSSIDYKQAVAWLKRSADQCFDSAQFYLGWCYEKGKGVAQDYTEAVSWYRKAAEQGLAAAQNNLGWCYKEGKGIEQDYAEAVNWYRKAAEQGDSVAQNNLGLNYQEGHGVDQDYVEAVKWYRKAAEQGLALAQNNLAWCYEEGKGLEQNYEEAVNWYSKAAEQGNSVAQYNLGLFYQEGKGVPYASYSDAVSWFRKASEQNFTKAKIALGSCYQEGKGIKKDYVKAMELFEDALTLSDGNAQAYIDSLNRKIDEEKRKEAERIAKEEAERKAKEEAERKAKEEAERKEKEKLNALCERYNIDSLKKSFIRIEGGSFLSSCSTQKKSWQKECPINLDSFFIACKPISGYVLNSLGCCRDLSNLSIVSEKLSKMIGFEVSIASIEQMEYVASSRHYRKPIINCHYQYVICSLGQVYHFDKNHDYDAFCFSHYSEFKKHSLYSLPIYNECFHFESFITCSIASYDAYCQRIAKEEAERIAKEEAERKAKEEAERKAKEEAERKAKEEAERKAKEEAERKAKEEAERKAKEEAERKAREVAERIAKEEAERKAKEEVDRKAKEEAERIAKEEAERKAKEEAENRLAEFRRLREANDDEFKTFCKDLLAKRAKAKSVGMLWKKSEEFEILTTPLTHNIYNSFRTGVVCTKSENETLMDQFKEKKDIALLIEKMENAYKDEGVTFTIPSSREIVGAQSAKVVGKEGVFLVCHFPEFEE